MSLVGSLDDVSVSDVLQFIHLGGRSGTLSLECDGRHAQIGFSRGRIISAHGPEHIPLGEWLLTQGAVETEEVEAALRVQKRMSRPTAIGKLLVEMGAVSIERLKELVELQIQQTVYGLVGWSSGTFEFEIDELRPIDDLSMSPGDILPDININTQMVLLEAARILDERNRANQTAHREQAPAPANGARSPAAKQETQPLADEPAPARVTVERPTSPLRVQIVSPDPTLRRAVEAALDVACATVVSVPARDAGSHLPGEVAPVVLVDLRSGDAALEMLSSIRRIRPRATLIGLADDPARHPCAHERGALALVPPNPEVIAASVRNVLRLRDDATESERAYAARMKGVAKLSRVFGEFRSGLLHATVSINLMNLVSESVERAVLFVAAPTRLVVLGAYGSNADGRQLAQHTREYHVPLDAAGVLAESLRDARSRTLAWDDSGLPASFTALIGKPASGSCTIFPLLGSRKVIATLYVDNGRKHTAIDDLEFLEVATAHVGMYYENELLRRQLQTTARLAQTARSPLTTKTEEP